MNGLIDTFSNRLCTAIRIRNIKPTELSEKCGIDKSKLSSYMSGRYKAKQDGIYLLSNALSVDPAWLMGYDVPMERIENISTNTTLNTQIERNYGINSTTLLNYYSELNDLGKERALENTKDLTKIQEYTEKKTNIQDA